MSGGGPAGESRVDMSAAMAAMVDMAAGRHREPHQRRRGGGGGLEHNDRATLMLVATLITTLSYQVGSNVPGGYWQDDTVIDKNNPAKHPHHAGDPILRDEHPGLYMLFRWASWVGFGSSMVLTMGLLTGVPTGSCFVRRLFVVSYSTLVLTFVTSQTHTFGVVWNVLLWIAVMAALTFAVSYRRRSDLIEWLRCGDIITATQRPAGTAAAAPPCRSCQ